MDKLKHKKRIENSLPNKSSKAGKMAAVGAVVGSFFGPRLAAILAGFGAYVGVKKSSEES